MDNYNLTTLCNLEHNPHRFLKQLESLNTQIENLDKKFTQPLNKFSDEFNTTLTELENKKGRISTTFQMESLFVTKIVP